MVKEDFSLSGEAQCLRLFDSVQRGEGMEFSQLTDWLLGCEKMLDR
jgi:hypothetical protein